MFTYGVTNSSPAASYSLALGEATALEALVIQNVSVSLLFSPSSHLPTRLFLVGNERPLLSYDDAVIMVNLRSMPLGSVSVRPPPGLRRSQDQGFFVVHRENKVPERGELPL